MYDNVKYFSAMTNYQVLILISAALAGSIAAFPVLSTKNRWPHGGLYEKGYTALIFLGALFLNLGIASLSAYQQIGT